MQQRLKLQTDDIQCGVFVSMYMAYIMSGKINEIPADVNMDAIFRFRECLTRLICEFQTEFPIPDDKPHEVYSPLEELA